MSASQNHQKLLFTKTLDGAGEAHAYLLSFPAHRRNIIRVFAEPQDLESNINSKASSQIAFISWLDDGGTDNVLVAPDYRGKGLARALVLAAQQISPELHPIGKIEPDGQKLIEALLKSGVLNAHHGGATE